MASIIGLGFVGHAVYKSFQLKGIQVYGYDKYKEGGIGTFEDTLQHDFIFLALPTPYNNELKEYDKSALHEICAKLNQAEYSGTVVIKSTVEPETTASFTKQYTHLHFVHNPEFLTARTAFEDFHNQKHIVLGKAPNCPEEKLQALQEFYQEHYADAEISVCSSLESESMKIFCNSFYSVKVQFFTELYLLCQQNGSNFELVRNMMLRNKWIHPMHTQVPGPDGQISYGGLCFPKDTNSLNEYMTRLETPHDVLTSTIKERNSMRQDHDNCQ